MPLLAVYGTLRKGLWNHYLIEGSRLVWEGYVELPYKMIVFEHSLVPALVPSSERHRIYVEVYEVSEELLEELDWFELGYKRVLVDTPVGRAWIYVIENFDEDNDLMGVVTIEHGDYKKYVGEERKERDGDGEELEELEPL